MKKIYISGPMSGYPFLNFPAFNEEAGRLRWLGYDVVNPAELNPEPNKSWSECMRVDIRALMDCDTIALLPDYGKSQGAQLELYIAQKLGFNVVMADSIRTMKGV